MNGQWKARRILTNALQSNKISHAYLFYGPSGSGKLELARTFAKSLFCMEEGGWACGQCLNCRRFDSGNHPDFQHIVPDGKTIKIDQMRELQHRLAYRTSDSTRKVYLIEQAEALTPQAANSLLKTLEDPVSPVVAMLLTDNLQTVLPTIRSRAQHIPFMSIAPALIRKILVEEGAQDELARIAAELSAGLDGAREMIQQEPFAEMRSIVIQLGKESLERMTAAMITAQQRWFKTTLVEHTPLLLSMMAVWFKDFILFQTGRREQIVFIDQLDWISQHARNRSIAGWVACMELTLEAGKRMRANVAPQLAFEQLLVRIQED